MTDSYVDYMRNRRGKLKPRTDNSDKEMHYATTETRYVRALPADRSRWLYVLPLSSDAKFPICEYTKVLLLKSDEDYTYFKISEGPCAGRSARLSNKNVESCLSKTPPALSKETLTVKYGKRSHARSAPRDNEDLDQQWATLTVQGKSVSVTLNSDWNGIYTPIPPGVHRVMVPDAPHERADTAFYVEYASRNGLGEIIADQVWFPIELAGSGRNSSRYIHLGNFSEGCVTVYALEQWNDIYRFLISHRLPDTQGNYVAYLEVTK